MNALAQHRGTTGLGSGGKLRHCDQRIVDKGCVNLFLRAPGHDQLL